MKWFNKIDVYQDGASIKNIKITIKTKKFIKGFTTNPSLMKNNGVKDYLKFCKAAAKIVGDKPISFEVFADSNKKMIKQAVLIYNKIKKKNVFIKIPIVNSKGVLTTSVIRYLANRKIPLNITAILTKNQIDEVVKNINLKSKIIISIFAGRIADTLRDPASYITYAKKKTKNYKFTKVLWASTREILNIKHAINSNCDIITIPDNLFSKFNYINYPLNKLSVETVKMFLKDAKSSRYKI